MQRTVFTANGRRWYSLFTRLLSCRGEAPFLPQSPSCKLKHWRQYWKYCIKRPLLCFEIKDNNVLTKSQGWILKCTLLFCTASTARFAAQIAVMWQFQAMTEMQYHRIIFHLFSFDESHTQLRMIKALQIHPKRTLTSKHQNTEAKMRTPKCPKENW